MIFCLIGLLQTPFLKNFSFLPEHRNHFVMGMRQDSCENERADVVYKQLIELKKPEEAHKA